MGKTAMPVPLPSEETQKQLAEQGIGLARDVPETYDSTKKRMHDATEEQIAQMGLNTGESMRTIPLKEPLEVDGKIVWVIKIDKDAVTVYDPSIIPGQVEQIGDTKKTKPNNYVRYPVTHPDIARFLERRRAEEIPYREKLLKLLQGWNKSLEDLAKPEVLKGVNLVQIPLMVFKERSQIIQPRLNELLQMESAVEANLQGAGVPSSIIAAEKEWLDKINSHELNFEDTKDTIRKLYRGREEQIIPDLESGVLNPSEEWRNVWLQDVNVRGNDGEVKTMSLLQLFVEKRREEKEEERNKPETVRPDVALPGKFLEELPEKATTSSPSFTGHSSTMRSMEFARLNGIKEEIKDLQELDQRLLGVANGIVEMESKSDTYILDHPEEYLQILNGIRTEASLFIRKHSGSIQNKPETWKTSPSTKTMNEWSDKKRQQLEPMDNGGMMLPGALNASFLGKNIASAGVTMYLFRIIAIIEAIDKRINEKRQSVQASVEMLKTAQIGPTEFNNPAKDKALNGLKVTALKRLNWIEENEDSVNEVFLSIANEIGASPDAIESLPLQLKVDMIEKAIGQMGYDRIEKFIKVISSL